MNFLILARWAGETCPSGLFSIYIIQGTVDPQAKYKTPIHPSRTRSNQVRHKNQDSPNIDQNGNETEERNQIRSKPYWHQCGDVIPVRR